MHSELVEIFSDATNAAVIKHPGRRFPGVLVQGDTLHTMCVHLDALCKEARGRLSEDAFAELNEHRNHLWDLLNHYKHVLSEHQIPLPFVEGPDA